MFNNMSKIDAERILNLTGTYNFDVVKIAYRRVVKENHPDAGGSNEKMTEINAAKDYFDNFFKTCSTATSEICVALSTIVSDTTGKVPTPDKLNPFDIIKHPWHCDWKNGKFTELFDISFTIRNSLYRCDGKEGRPTLDDALDFFDWVIDLGGGHFFATDFINTEWGSSRYLRDHVPDKMNTKDWMRKLNRIYIRYAELVNAAA